MTTSKRWLILFAALVATALTLLAQAISGDLVGTIYDQTGAAVPNAKIVAKNEATGVETPTVATAAGQYRIPNLPVGTYDLTVSAAGFTTAQIKGVVTQLSVTVTRNVTLTVGQNVQTVEVTTSGAAIDTTTAQIQNSFGTQQLENLPGTSTGSGVLNLSLLNAGTATSGAVGVGSGPSVGGQRPRDNNFTIEGIDNNDDSVTGPVVSVPNDSVAEFTVLQNQFSAVFGHSSGGQFNQVVKSGTNNFHGMAYEYLQNRNLNAADNFNAVQQIPLHTRFDDNRFGGNFGGPIKRDKLFFFMDYEYEPVGSAGSAGVLFAPTAAGWSTLAGIPGINQTSLSILHQYLGTAGSAAPQSTTPNGAYPLVGPGNESLGNQTASAVSIPIGQIGISAPSYSNNERAVAAIDDTISEKDSLRFRFILNRSGFIDTAASLPVFYTTTPTNSYLTTFSEYHSFSPTATNEFRLGYNRYSNNYPVGPQTWPGLDQFPNINIFELGVQLGPNPNNPQFGFQNTYEMTNNLTITKEKHTITLGFDGYRLISPSAFTQRSRGDYEWSYLSDYLFDYNPDYLAQRSLGNAVYYGNRWWLAGYAQDSWKVRPNLTVDLGLRYEFVTVPYSENLQDLNAASSVPGLINFTSPKPDTRDIMPRVGIAYSPGTSGHTSIRAGFGINRDVLFDNLGLLTLPPQITTTVDVTGLDQGSFLAQGGIAPTATGSALSVADARAGTGGYISNEIRPESYQWNIGIQHVFHQDYTIESRYVGTRGLYLPVQIQLNRQPVVNSSNALPMFFAGNPGLGVANSLTNTLDKLNAVYNAGGNVIPAYLNAGFSGIITSYQPWGSSTYHGWQNQFTRRFRNGLNATLSYTWSNDIDNSTAEVFSTYITPRRPEDSTNLNLDRGESPLDHRQVLTAAIVYQFTPFKTGNWFLKNIVGNWEIAPLYHYQTGTWWDVQSGIDSNLNGDSAGDRAFVNPAGKVATGSAALPLLNSAGQTVGYYAANPNARYIQAPKGTLPNGGRDTEHLNPIDDFDLSFAKLFNVTERAKLQFSVQAFNVLNHPQYVGGNISDVAPIGFTGTAQHNFLEPQSTSFAIPQDAFSSNPRSIVIFAKVIF